MRLPLFLILILLSTGLMAQNQLKITVLNTKKEPLPGASVSWGGSSGVTTDSAGYALLSNIPGGSKEFKVSHVGYREQVFKYNFPVIDSSVYVVTLEEEEEEEEEVIVTATRTSRTITNTPTRVEVISGEELEEKGNMKPGDIRMLLNESTGIQTQQTSATSYNAGIRIQGLDGRYTQVLRDGYPLYAGFSGGLSLLQIAPLDLRQVEVIKGSASTLYGGGAIAGLVNLVSKTPGEERELNFLANATSAGGLDLSGFYSERYGKAGLTLFASRNSNKAFDPADIGLTAIPEFERYTINPRLFLYGSRTTADLGFTYITENRTGGSLDYIKNGGSGFFEKNNSKRMISQLGVQHRLSEHSRLQFKNSYSIFDRLIAIPSYSFDAMQRSSFSELSWSREGELSDWVVGANYITEDLEEKNRAASARRDYRLNTAGLFIQNNFDLSSKLVLETGLRLDHVNNYGWELLPRISTLWRINDHWTTRIGGGFGYKAPTIFTEEAERIQFRIILPIVPGNTRNERSVGGNWDIHYRSAIGDLGISINQLFFYTRLNRPLILTGSAGFGFEFRNAQGRIDAKGMETNIRLVYHDFKLFLGYTYTDANTYFDSKEWLPLTARHRLNNVLMYEVEEKWKLGLEAYYYGKQQLSNGSYSPSYWITGFMAEKIWEKFSVFINFENFTDTRQSKFGPIYSGSINDPQFSDIYAPVEGFVVNGGLKLRL